jgi:hypothetical protein
VVKALSFTLGCGDWAEEGRLSKQDEQSNKQRLLIPIPLLRWIYYRESLAGLGNNPMAAKFVVGRA